MKLRITTQADPLHFYGHGKLLITGEYFVLDGAEALAVPTRHGQHLRVKELSATDNTLYWVALNNRRQIWLNLVFDKRGFSCLNANTPEASRLSSILAEAQKLNPKFLNNEQDLAVETLLEFPNEWGLGSSSTLIYTIAKWANVDGYKLLQQTIGGSGYDVACAGSAYPILYTLQNNTPQALPVHWEPPFANCIYFAYLGKKQLSSEAIKYYREKLNDKTHIANQLTRLTQLVLKCNNLTEFELLISEHENIVGAALKLMKVKDTYFQDYWGSIKSLGAWGGDFVMLTNTRTREELTQYLHGKNIPTVFGWKEMVLTSEFT